MLTFLSLEENHNFLMLETISQFTDMVLFLETPSPDVMDRMKLRNEYIRNMKNTMENDCFKQLFLKPDLPGKDVQKVRALHRIALACRRMANHCLNMCDQYMHMADRSQLARFPWKDMAGTAEEALRAVPRSMNGIEEYVALSVCQAEQVLDRQYDAVIDLVAASSTGGPEAFRGNLIVVLIARYLEAVGDELLRIGEALLSAMVGERIQYHEYEAIRRGLGKLNGGSRQGEVRYHAFWGSRSGCVIGMVSHEGKRSIFKEGPVKKVRREMENMQAWKDAMPGLAPEVYSYTEDDGLGALLMEVVPGVPLDEILLGDDPGLLDTALGALVRTVRRTWNVTLEREPVQVASMSQVLDRLDKVRQVHPGLGAGPGGMDKAMERIRQARELEMNLTAPVSVFVHGDFNLNNIFYDRERDAIHYVDLYRSRRADYAQDLAVHLVSYARIPVLEEAVRERMMECITRFHAFAADFAREHGDTGMPQRLTLALARALITSTRFELRGELAQAMFTRAYAMLDVVLAQAGEGDGQEGFVAPIHLLDLRI